MRWEVSSGGKKEINEAYLVFTYMHPCSVLLTGRFALQREDTEKIGELRYFPPNGTFNLMYYPYYGKKAQVKQSNPD